jgi:hypothetical protein
MTRKTTGPSDPSWLERFMAGTSPVQTGVPAFRPQMSPSERKADDTARHVRELTDAATQERVATSARLRALRLEKEAEDRARAIAEPPTRRRPKAKG